MKFPLFTAAAVLGLLISGQAFALATELQPSLPESASGTSRNADPESPFVNWTVIRARPSALPVECINYNCFIDYSNSKSGVKTAIWTITLPRSLGAPEDCKNTFCHSDSAYSSDGNMVTYYREEKKVDQEGITSETQPIKLPAPGVVKTENSLEKRTIVLDSVTGKPIYIRVMHTKSP